MEYTTAVLSSGNRQKLSTVATMHGERPMPNWIVALCALRKSASVLLIPIEPLWLFSFSTAWNPILTHRA